MIPFLPTPANYGPDVPPLALDCATGCCSQSCQQLNLNSDGSLSWREFAGCTGGDCGSCALAKCGSANSGGLFPFCAKQMADLEDCATCKKPLAWTVVDAPSCTSDVINCPVGFVYDTLSELCVLRPPIPFIPPELPHNPPFPPDGGCLLTCQSPMVLDRVNCKCIDPPMPSKGGTFYGRAFV